jgi:hypothetical protein
MTEIPEKKKRGRKKQVPTVEENPIINVPKKRGRKPKGGKIIVNPVPTNKDTIHIPNIILHLKCSLKDITSITFNDHIYNPGIETIESFQFNNNTSQEFCEINEQISPETTDENLNINTIITDKKYQTTEPISIENTENTRESENKIIWNKLKTLSYNLHTNNIEDKKSACFWCTEKFDGPPIHIPQNKLNETTQVYGCFCSPECASSFLFKESIDTTTKFERYQMLNNLYREVYQYKKNIKPAPSPYYLLDKYYGNLSIDEYRKLFKNERILLVVSKPLTRIYPEIFDENNEYPTQHFQPTTKSDNTYRLSRKNTNKTGMFNEGFGI